ncbi:unnamed protein product [Sphenostylis stenocarpa]|uniref:B box-type domain-containing protein n=1 Tax=Sphenostylis stenocarpa TaxID=92480 RepID=A0AA86W510_9FABA|nr:unnamed protein product [Sphenostylis stenocarpa]
MLCDSDQAKLCWDCDEKVHSANFLVAKHSRVLLCRLCHSPTPWKASGTKLTPTVSFCHRCVLHRHARFNYLVNSDQQHSDEGNGSDHVLDADNSDYTEQEEELEDEEEEEEDDDDEEGENQVVPMSSGSATSPPSDYSGLALKRLKNNSFAFDSHDDTACSSSEIATLSNNDESTSRSVLGALKRHRVDERNY